MIVFNEDPVIFKLDVQNKYVVNILTLEQIFIFVEYQNNAIISHYALKTVYHLNMSHITLLQK